MKGQEVSALRVSRPSRGCCSTPLRTWRLNIGPSGLILQAKPPRTSACDGLVPLDRNHRLKSLPRRSGILSGRRHDAETGRRLTRCQVRRLKVVVPWQAVIEITAHLPAARIEAPSGAAGQTGSISLAFARKWAAHLFVPATKHSTQPTADSKGFGSLLNVMTVLAS